MERACMKRSSNDSHQRHWSLPRALPPPSSRPVQSKAASGAAVPGPALRSCTRVITGAGLGRSCGSTDGSHLISDTGE